MGKNFFTSDMSVRNFDFFVGQFGRPKDKRLAVSRLLKVKEIDEFAVGSTRTWSWRARKNFQRNQEMLPTELMRTLPSGEFSAKSNFYSVDGHHFLHVTVHPFDDEDAARLAVPMVRMKMHFHDEWRFTEKSLQSPDVIEVPNHEPFAIEELEGTFEGQPRLSRFCVIGVSRFVVFVILTSKSELSSVTSFESILKKQAEKLIRLSEEDSR